MVETSPAGQSVNDPLISVVVISFEFERYLAECLDSIIAQSLRPFEIIVCDDCSTDDSWKIISDYADRHADLIVAFRHPENVGHIANGTHARNMVRGDLLSVIDGDDRWAPHKLEREWAALCADQSARIAYSNVRGIDRHGRETRLWHDGAGKPPPQGDIFVETFSRQFFHNVQSVYRNELVYTHAVRAVGGLADDIPIHVDWDLKLRLAARFPAAYADSVGVDYRTHDSNMNARTSEAERRDSMRLVVAKNSALLDGRTDEEKCYIQKQLAFLN